MVDCWLEDSGFSFDCEEVGPIDVVDPSAIRKAETLVFVGIEDETAVDSFDALLAVCPRGLAFNDEVFGLLSGEEGKKGEPRGRWRGFLGVVYLGLVVGWRRCHDSKHRGSES
jgi:hypothetical protein